MMDLNGKRVLVTGGTKGIGAAIAIDLAKGSADVAINGRFDDDEAKEVCQKIRSLDRKAVVIVANMAVPDEVERCVCEAVDELGGLDVLIHAAGGPSPGRIEEVSPEQWTATFDVHVHAAYHVCRHALPHLAQNDESAIVLVSSVAGIRGCPGAIAYGTAKGAVLQFTRMLARDVADDGVRVNCVAPGIIWTRFHENMTPAQKQHNLAQRIPLHRGGEVEDVAEVVRLLVTNRFMTGETIVVDGGTSMQVVR